jgi:hypothetical protein
MKNQISRRGFLKNSALVLGAAVAFDFKDLGSAIAAQQNKSQMFLPRISAPMDC